MRRTYRILFLAAVSACGGGAQTPNAPATVPTVFAASMPVPQQIAFMKANVQPKMRAVFQEHDASKYGEFACKTCHGPNAQNPHKYLPTLRLSGDGYETLVAKKPEMVKWMHEKVEPAMALAMGQQPFDEKTNTGFGCKGCHTIE